MIESGRWGRVAPEIREAVRQCRSAILAVALFSALINMLALTGSFYMLQLYDRVIPSHSVPTLVGLSVLMLILYAGYGVLDMVRTRVFSRVGLRLDRALRERVFGLVLALPLCSRRSGDGLLPVRDLDALRSFFAGSGPIALFDAPWIPFYLGLIYLMHPWLGLLAAGGAALLVAVTLLTEVRTRAPSQATSAAAAARQSFGEAGRRNAEVVRALGMGPQLTARWSRQTEHYFKGQVAVIDVTAKYSNLSKVMRFVLQSAVLGLGAYLVIVGQGTAGITIAAAILTSRALAPIEIAIANWRGFLAARQSASRLSSLFASLPAKAEPMPLPPPRKSLAIEGAWVAAPGQQKPIVSNISFALEAGSGLGVIGPSASGKSTLARAIVGAWAPLRGAIRLDGAELGRWTAEALGQHIGYLPQDIELFDGTVAENIARFDASATSERIIAAAERANVHEMILALPEGYDTRIGEDGMALSAGQRQRVALARALYGDPFLVVLDEPNSNLDAEGEAALAAAIQSARSRGGIVIVVAHRPSALASLDQILMMGNGQLQAFGPKEEILRQVTQPAAQQPRFKVITDTSAGTP